MKWMERSKRSLTVRIKHEDDDGVNGDSNMSHSVRASNKEDSQRTTTLTDNKKRDYENEGSSMHEDSCIGINYAHMFPECFRSLHTLLGFSLCTSCRLFFCCRCNHLLNFWPVREFLVEIHIAKTGLSRCCLCTSRRRSCNFQDGIGLSGRSPDSWCKRFNVDNASLKSERFLNGPVFPDLLREMNRFCVHRKYSDYVM